MDFAFIVQRAKAILLTPKEEWPVIEAEQADHKRILLTWLLPLSLIPALASFIGHGIFGFGGMHFAIGLGVRHLVIQLISVLGGAYVTAFIINALADTFASRKNFDKAFALVAYTYTPICLGGIFQIVPALASLGSLIGLYGLYLLYVGLPPLMKTPAEKSTAYFVVSLICIIAVFFVLSAVLATIFMSAIFMIR